MKDVMVDIETLSTNRGGALVSIGACYFGCGIGATFYRAVRWEGEDMPIHPGTLRWWLQQDNCMSELIGEPRYPLDLVLDQFSGFISNHKRIWAKGPDFDLNMLQSHYQNVGKKLPWHFRDARDVRTMLWLGRISGTERIPRSGVAHNALDDAIYQADQVDRVLRQLKLSPFERPKSA